MIPWDKMRLGKAGQRCLSSPEGLRHPLAQLWSRQGFTWETIMGYYHPRKFSNKTEGTFITPKVKYRCKSLKEVSFYLVLENFKVFFFFNFKTRFHISPPDLKRPVLLRMKWNLWSHCFHLPSVGWDYRWASQCSVYVVQGWEVRGEWGEGRVGSNLELCACKAGTALTGLHA